MEITEVISSNHLSGYRGIKSISITQPFAMNDPLNIYAMLTYFVHNNMSLFKDRTMIIPPGKRRIFAEGIPFGHVFERADVFHYPVGMAH